MKEVTTVIVFFTMLVVALVVPLLLMLAIALGPVTLGILCAAAFGLIVFVAVNFVIALGLFGRSLERHLRHTRSP
jgi:hypothetical protein